MSIKQRLCAWWHNTWPPWPFRKREPKPKKTLKQEAKDWIIAFAAAAILYFIILPGILGTGTPMVVVSSCSEQGFLNIGDVLVLQGANISHLRAPEVEINGTANIALFSKDQANCSDNSTYRNGEIVAIGINGNIVCLNRSNDVIVYVAFPSNAQIIHKVFVKLSTSQGTYVITKGDANDMPDQFGSNGMCVSENVGCISTLVTQKMLVGKQAMFAIPLLGHVKLFFCDITLGALCEGHSNRGTGGEYKLWC